MLAYLSFMFVAQNGQLCPDTKKYKFNLNCLEHSICISLIRLQVTLYMEMENIRYGKLRGYEGIFTTNANRLTQHISRILGYQILSTIQVNQYEDYNGSRPFAEAPDDLVTEVALKWFD